MMRWLVVWHLRRRRDALTDRVDWIRDCVWSAQAALETAEADLRKVQARLWCVEEPCTLLHRGRADAGVSSRGK